MHTNCQLPFGKQRAQWWTHRQRHRLSMEFVENQYLRGSHAKITFLRVFGVLHARHVLRVCKVPISKFRAIVMQIVNTHTHTIYGPKKWAKRYRKWRVSHGRTAASQTERASERQSRPVELSVIWTWSIFCINNQISESFLVVVGDSVRVQENVYVVWCFEKWNDNDLECNEASCVCVYTRLYNGRTV